MQHGGKQSRLQPHMPRHQHVFQHGHVLEQTDVLEGARHAHLGDFIRRVGDEVVVLADVRAGVELAHFAGGMTLRNDLAAQLDATVGGRVHAGDDIERGGLARTVGADQGNGLALVYVHAEAVHGHHAAELHGYIFEFKDGFDDVHFPAPFPAAFAAVFLRKRSGSSREPMMP